MQIAFEMGQDLNSFKVEKRAIAFLVEIVVLLEGNGYCWTVCSACC